MSEKQVKRLAIAEVEAAAARDRVSRTLATLQARLNPKRLARRALDDATGAGSTAARAGLEQARRHPGAFAGVTALAGLFLARRHVADLFRRATRGKKTS